MDSKKTYEAQLGSSYQIALEEDQTLELELIEVNSVTAERTETGQAEPFSAIFQSQMMDALEQGTYTLNHAEMGELLLFIVPIGPDDKGMRYEAVFT